MATLDLTGLARDGFGETAPGKRTQRLLVFLQGEQRPGIKVHHRQDSMQGVIGDFLEIQRAVDGIGDEINRGQPGITGWQLGRRFGFHRGQSLT